MRDNKGKIQYIRPAIIKDKLNNSIKRFFNELPDEKKLNLLNFLCFFICYMGL